MARSAWVGVIVDVARRRRPRAAPARRAGRGRRRRGSARSGTTAARAARWRRAAGAPSATASLTAISACSRISRRMSRPEDRERLEVVDRLDGGRAPLVVEHRQLAEDLAGAERGERDLAAVGVLADRPRVAAADDVARVGGVALAEDRLARPAKRRGIGHRGDRVELRGAELAKAGTWASSAAVSSTRAGIGQAYHTAAPGGAAARRRPSRGGQTRVERVLAPAPAARRAAPGRPGRRAARAGARRRGRSRATPAATSSTRSASRAASPGRQPSSVVGAAAPASRVGDERDRDGGEGARGCRRAAPRPARPRSRVDTSAAARGSRAASVTVVAPASWREQALALGPRVLQAARGRTPPAR